MALEKSEHEKKKAASRQGRRSRAKGAAFERRIAKKLKAALGADFVRTPQSGGFAKGMEGAEGFRGDVLPAGGASGFLLHVEAKNAKAWAMAKWMAQAEADAPEGKVPVVVAHRHGTSRDFLLIDFDDFLRIVPLEVLMKGGV